MRRSLAMALAGSAILLPGGTLASVSPAGDATVQTGDFTLSFNNDGGATAFCPPGKTATGGGFGTVDPPPLNVAINVSAPVNKTQLPAGRAPAIALARGTPSRTAVSAATRT